jgi:hypothetical protein
LIAGLVLVEGMVLALPGTFTGASVATLRAARLPVATALRST